VPQFLRPTPPTGASSNLNISAFRAVFWEDGTGLHHGRLRRSTSRGPWNPGSLGAGNQTADDGLGLSTDGAAAGRPG
jgi:hypothetical protein